MIIPILEGKKLRLAKGKDLGSKATQQASCGARLKSDHESRAGDSATITSVSLHRATHPRVEDSEMTT